jgi:hypothetical protein
MLDEEVMQADFPLRELEHVEVAILVSMEPGWPKN